MTDQRPINVLFLCRRNSARSVIAECVMNRLGMGRFKGFSAGSHPEGTIHPYVLDLLRQLNYDTSTLRSKSWDEFASPGASEMDFVFTVCDGTANEVCPVWPGRLMTAHWGLPDPVAARGTESERRFAFADAHRMLYQRVSIFTSLPFAALDKFALQKQLEEIGYRKVVA